MVNQLLKGTFKFAGELLEVVIDGNNIMFMDVSTGMITTPEGLRISKDGVIKEFPDLEKNEDWKKEAIKRLKDHIKTFPTLDKKLDYVKDELVKDGYTPLFKQKAGFRPHKF